MIAITGEVLKTTTRPLLWLWLGAAMILSACDGDRSPAPANELETREAVPLTPQAVTEPEKGESPVSLEEALNLLEQATSPAAEAEAFDLIWRSSEALGFGAYDEDDKQVPVSSPDFPERVAHIQLRVDGQVIEHDVIEPENLFVLMRE